MGEKSFVAYMYSVFTRMGHLVVYARPLPTYAGDRMQFIISELKLGIIYTFADMSCVLVLRYTISVYLNIVRKRTRICT